MPPTLVVLDLERCGTVKGLNFRIPGAEGLRVVVVSSLLERDYGAIEGPQAWLAAFHVHQGDIVARALAARVDESRLIVLR